MDCAGDRVDAGQGSDEKLDNSSNSRTAGTSFHEFVSQLGIGERGSMHSILWGVVRFQSDAAPNADLDALSAAIRPVASIHSIEYQTTDGASFAQAKLCLGPVDQRADETSKRVEGDVFLCDARVFGDAAPDAASALQIALKRGELSAIDGDFACALWNPAKRQLMLARDIMGVRPLFFVHKPGEFVAFSSLMQPLIDAGFATNARDLGTVVQTQMRTFNDGENTLLRDIKRVCPASVATITANSVTQTPYWTLDTRIQQTEPEAAAAELRRLLDKAIRKRLPVTGPVATHVTGGLDSSSITSLAAKAMAEDGRTVAGHFVEGPRRDDVDTVDGTSHVAAIKQRWPNVSVHTTAPQSPDAYLFDRLRDDFPAAERDDDHWRDGFEHAAKMGASILLSGYGGNETASFSGSTTIGEALSGLRLREAGDLIGTLADIEDRPRWEILGKEILRKFTPEALLRRYRARKGARPGPAETAAGFLTAQGRQMAKAAVRTGSARNDLLLNGRLTHNAEFFAIEGARYGVAVSFPFLDRELIEFTARLPGTAFFRDGQRRWLIRAAMKDCLPEMIATRESIIPFDSTMMLVLAERRCELLEEVERMRTTPACKIFDLDKVKAAILAMPDVDTVRSETAEKAKTDEVADHYGAQFIVAYMVARFLAAETAEQDEDGKSESSNFRM